MLDDTLDPLLASIMVETPSSKDQDECPPASPKTIKDDQDLNLNEKKNDDIKNKENTKKNNPNWCVEEDKSLCVSWLNTSKDAITGTNQSAKGMWERIHLMYQELMDNITKEKKNTKLFKLFPMRLQGALEYRWSIIQHRVNIFCGYVAQIERRKQSGSNNDDLVVEAKEIYRTQMGTAFTLDHCWGLLAHSPKREASIEENNSRSNKSKFKEDKPSSLTVAQSIMSDTSITDQLSSISEQPVLNIEYSN